MDSFVVSSRWVFTGNLEFLERLSAFSERAATGMEAMTKSMQSFNRTLTRTAGLSERAGAAMSGMRDRVAGVGAAYDRSAMAAARFNRESNITSRAGGAGMGVFEGLSGIGKGASIAALATELVGIREAAKTQNAAIQLAIGTGSSPAATQARFTNAALNMSNITAMSMADAFSGIQTLSTFVKNPRTLNDPKFQTSVARFADLMYLNPNGSAPFNESIAQAGRVSHMLGAYTGDEITPVLTSLYKARYSTPDKLKPMINQMAYYSELYGSMMRPKGASSITQAQRQEIINTAILGDLTIGAGKWGNAYRTLGVNLLRPTAAQARAQVGLGLRDGKGLTSAIADENGNLDPIKFLRYLGKGGELRSGTDQATRVFSAFNQSAATIASVAGTDKAMRLFDQIKVSQAKMPDLETAQKEAMSGLTSQTKRLETNFKDFANILSGPLIAPLTSAVTRLSDALNSASKFLLANPGASHAASAALAVGAGVGGYLALRFLGGARIFAHAAIRAGGASLGIGEWAGKAAGAGEKVAGRGGILKGLLGGFNVGDQLARVADSFGDIGMKASVFGRRLITTGPGIRMLGAAIGRLGIRALPVAGNILLMIDAIRAFVTHGTNISAAVGKMTAWVNIVGWPMLQNAWTNGWKNLVSAIMSGLQSVINWIGTSFKNLIPGMGGNGQGGIQGFAAWAGQWIHQQRNNNEWAEKHAYDVEQRRLQGGKSGDIHVTNLVLPGVKNKEDLGAHFRDFRHQTSRVGGAPASSVAPPFLTIGKAYGQ